jgi:hypothetical protein
VVEYRKKEFELALQYHLAPRVRRKSARKLGRPGYKTRELVGAPGELQSRQIGRVDSLGIRNSCERVLEFVGEAIRDEVGNPALRQ